MAISSACYILHSGISGIHKFSSFKPDFSDWAEIGLTLSSGQGYDSIPLPEQGGGGADLASGAERLLFEDFQSDTCALLSFLVRLCHYLGFADEQSYWLGLLLRC